MPSDKSSRKRGDDLSTPRYITNKPMKERTSENDVEALKLAKLAQEILLKKRDKSATERKSKHAAKSQAADGAHEIGDGPEGDADPGVTVDTGPNVSKGVDIESNQDEQHVDGSVPDSALYTTFRDPNRPDVKLPLKSMYEEDENIAEWPKKNDPVPGAYRWSWSNIGFPHDDNLAVKSFEDATYIERDEPFVAQLTRDIANLQNKPAKDVADHGSLKTIYKHKRTIESFSLHSRKVVKVQFEDADVHKKEPTYDVLQTARELEKEIDRGMGQQPALKVEQWVATQLLLCLGGQVGGRTQDYWKRVRDLAQQQLHLNKDLEAKALRQMDEGISPDTAFVQMLKVVKVCLPRKAFNPYFQARRDEYAVKNNLFYHAEDADIVMVLDKNNKIIAFVCAEAFRKLLTKGVEKDVAQALETYSTMNAVPFPDMTRHGLHWIDWLVERPDLDFRGLKNDCRLAKSGVYHFGARFPVGHFNGVPRATNDLSGRVSEGNGLPLMELRYSALGACTEVVGFFFNILDTELFREYKAVAKEVRKLEYIPFATRREDEIFVMRAALINLMTNEHKDKGDWHYGLAGLVSMGDFRGGDLLLRDLGLRIKSPPGCVQLIRGRELRHSITKWTGRRFVVVNVTHEAIRRWARKQMGDPVVTGTTTQQDSCQDANPEDHVPEEDRVLSYQEMFPEVTMSDSDEFASDKESERSMEGGPRARRARLRRPWSGNSSDADTEANEKGDSKKSRKKL